MASKLAGSWLKGWQFWLQESGAPDNYILWSGISAIAGATERSVFLKWGYQTFYTNEYVIFVGPPGITFKSSTIEMVRQLYRQLDIPRASESLSREELIEQMIKRGDGLVSAITLLPDEFSDLLVISGPKMVEFLTTIYSCPSSWEYSTRLRSTEEIENAFLNMLGGTTPDWLAENFDISFVKKGFASRVIFIREEEPRFMRADMTITDEMYKMYNFLVEELNHIRTLEGEFQWKDDAWKFFVEWHDNSLLKEIRNRDHRIRGYMARKPTHLLKLAMILQLSRSDELYITKESISEAKELLDNLESNMARTFSAVGRNIYANDLERIYAEMIQEGGQMSKTEVLARNYNAMPRQAFEEQLQTLVDMGKVRRELRGTETHYVVV